MKKKMLFFVNPNAGHVEIRSSLMEVLEIFSTGGYDITIHPTAAPRDLTRQIVARGAEFDLIVCTGGDGTLNEAVSGLMQLPADKRPPLGYIPGGTVNDVASTLGLSRDPVTAAEEILSGHEFAIDIGSFGDDRWFAYVAAFGLFTDVSYETPQEDKRALGRLAYLLAGARSLGDIKPVHMRVSCCGETIEADVLDGLVCSTTSVGGFRPRTTDLDVALNDGLAEVLLVRNFKNVIDFSNAAGCLLRGSLQNEYFIARQADTIRFEFDEPVAWTLDGEYGGDRKAVEIRVNRQAVRIIVP